MKLSDIVSLAGMSRLSILWERITPGSRSAWRLGLGILDHLLQGYGFDPEITQMISSSEIWFVPAAES